MGRIYLLILSIFLFSFSILLSAQENFHSVPVFPGAKEVSFFDKEDVMVKVYETNASFEQVLKFYEELGEVTFTSSESDKEKRALIEVEKGKDVIIKKTEDVTIIRIRIEKEIFKE